MHKVYHPDKAPKDYNFEEHCPHCGEAIPVVIDNHDLEHYALVCPVCKKELMLCTLCQWDQEEETAPRDCDFHDGTCYRRERNDRKG